MFRYWLLAVLLALAGCGEKPPAAFQGYAEGEFVLVAAPYGGRLEKRYVNRGAEVDAGKPLFVLEQENEKAARREAEERLRNAEAKAQDLVTGKRAPEVDTVRAQEAQARAARKLAERTLQQQKALYEKGFASEEAFNNARASYERDIAKVEETEAQIRVARQTVGREKEIAAAQAEIGAARAVLAQSDWRLEQRSIAAPMKALVHDTLYSEGEWVAAGSPVVSLLPPGNVKLRFFVPETVVGALKYGQDVSASCDGCPAPIPAKITYISRQAEYTPPFIYSREQRAKLVFLVEARPAPADAAKLKPGQPLDVVLH
ncbi:MAG TPA: HlyD family efflux transporter periplasmic adaptor subunit [Burkholderiales bacterium]|jgi:HlyD family secretion protein|nr:HlyD family efflux transporter periplasmic adaptor subunit [Burkholderiales bacterium]